MISIHSNTFEYFMKNQISEVTSCSTDNGGCEHECENDSNGEFYRCRCRVGFKLSENKRSCQPVDPCFDNKGGCQHHCTNNHGRAQCQCYPGFHLSYDRRSCVGTYLLK